MEVFDRILLRLNRWLIIIMLAAMAMMVFANVVRDDDAYRMLYVYPQVFVLKILLAGLPDTLPAGNYTSGLIPIICVMPAASTFLISWSLSSTIPVPVKTTIK